MLRGCERAAASAPPAGDVIRKGDTAIMSKIIGIEEIRFMGKDGKEVVGKRIHFTDPIDAGRGIGDAGDKIFLSSAKLAVFDFAPAVGMTVDILYDKGGHVKAVAVVDDDVI